MGTIKTIDFHGDDLIAFEREGEWFVALKPIVEAMGLDWSGQRQRIHRDPILSEGAGMIPSPFGRGGEQEALCLRLDLINGWLFTIDSSRIKDESVRDKVLMYQRECYRVLFEHFRGQAEAPVAIDAAEDISQPTIADQYATATISERRRHVNTVNTVWGTAAARQLYLKLGLMKVDEMFVQSDQGDLRELWGGKTIEGTRATEGVS